MSEESGSVEKLLATLRPPEPAPALQESVLSGARAALTREAARDAWTRVWESRPLRIAWAVAVVVLVICHAGITELRSASARAGTQTARAVREGNGELAAIARLPRLDGNAQPLVGVEAYRLVEERQSIRPPTAKGRESAS
jgi:hypothetical protein